MSPSRFLRKLAHSADKSRQQRELREEMRNHLEMNIEEKVASGMAPAEARQAALREFGNPLLLREQSADEWSLPLESWWQDVRYAARALRKSPGFTAVAVLTLALGIGANAAIFSIVHGVLLQPLPYANADRLVRIDETGPGSEYNGFALMGVSPPDYWAYKEQNRAFEAVAAYNRNTVLVKAGEQPERVHSLDATHDLFNVLGRQPILGRTFTTDEEPPTAEAQRQSRYHVAIVSWKFWQHQLAGDKNVLGRTVQMNAQPYTIVGVMPRDFDFPVDGETDVYTPLGVTRDPEMQGARYLGMLGRLKPGVSVEQARSDLSIISKQQKPYQWVVLANQLEDSVVRSVRPSLWMLAGAVAFVLLIAASNLASLALSRVTARQKDAAVRLALGAGRWRLARSLMAEAMLLALLGAAAGLLVARFALASLLAVAPPDLPRVHEIAINAPVVAFTILAALLTGLLLGAAPAWRAGKTELNQTMKEGGPTLAGTRTRLQSAIVCFEVVLAVVLLVGAGLMIRSMQKLHAIDPGFHTGNVLTAEIVLPETVYTKPEQQRGFIDELLPRLQALPGVESVAATSNLPMTGSDMVFNLMFYGKKGTPAKSIVAGFRSITPEYFKTLKMPLLSGRDFTAADNQDAPLVGIANQALVKQMWGTENPIGKKMPTGFLPKEVTIIGVVPDMLYNGLDSAPKPELFVPYAQKPWGFMRLAIRTRGEPMSLATALAQQVRAIDPGQSVDKVRPFADILRNSAAERNFYMLLLTIFAGLALALAAVGVFGVISYAVTQRTHEIGVRIALGASAQQIMAMVLRKGMLPAAIGLAAGLGCAAALNRVMRNLLFGIKGTDPLTFAAVALVLVVAATAACYLPARRATRVDPMRALRYE